MSVLLIKGMEMPRSCGKCFVGDRTICADGCPLAEVKEPHGRLIDADEMIRIWDGATFEGSVKPLIDVRPTVIEAEGVENDNS